MVSHVKSVNLYLSVHEQNAMTKLFHFTHFISFPLGSLKKIMKRFTEDFFFCMKANIYTGAVQFIDIYNYYDVKTKRLFSFNMSVQRKATVSYMLMAWTVNNTVAQRINNKVDNKLLSGPADQQMHALLVYILEQAG